MVGKSAGKIMTKEDMEDEGTCARGRGPRRASPSAPPARVREGAVAHLGGVARLGLEGGALSLPAHVCAIVALLG